MIRLQLPNIYEYADLNLKLHEIWGNHPDWSYDNVFLSEVVGNYTWAISSGEEFNNNKNSQPDYELINKNSFIYSDNGMALILDFSNLNYHGEYDTYLDVILQLNNRGGNRIEISDKDLIPILNSQYSDYHYVISESANILDIKEIEQLIEDPIIDTVFVNRSLIPKLIESNISLRKIGLVINPMCPLDCPHINECLKKQNDYQYSYSLKNVYSECNKRYDLFENPQILSLSYINSDLYSKGFHFFKLKPFPPNIDIKFVKLYLASYIFKQEYVQQVVESLDVEVEND